MKKWLSERLAELQVDGMADWKPDKLSNYFWLNEGFVDLELLAQIT